MHLLQRAVNSYGIKEINWPVHSGMTQWSLVLRKEVGDTNNANHPKTERSNLQRDIGFSISMGLVHLDCKQGVVKKHLRLLLKREYSGVFFPLQNSIVSLYPCLT